MFNSATLRHQIEASLASRISSALTPALRTMRPVVATGIQNVDKLLEGGLPLGAITELVGPECSGRTSLALSVLAGITQAAKACAWIDVSDVLDPESAASVGVDLTYLLWVRCGVPSASRFLSSQDTFSQSEKYRLPLPIKKKSHNHTFGSHPRNEVKGLSDAVSDLLRPQTFVPRYEESQHRMRTEEMTSDTHSQPHVVNTRKPIPSEPWTRIDQALRVTDLLLQASGFSAIVLDMGSIAPEYVSRVPLATWFRYRAAAERSQSSILLLTQHPCAKSSGELLLQFQPGSACRNETTVFTGIEYRLEVVRRRFTQTQRNFISQRKPPQSESTANWLGQTTWAGPR